MANRMIPTHEIPEAIAWTLAPFVALGLALWALRAYAERRRAKRFAAEDERIEEQRKREQLAVKEAHRG